MDGPRFQEIYLYDVEQTTNQYCPLNDSPKHKQRQSQPKLGG